MSEIPEENSSQGKASLETPAQHKGWQYASEGMQLAVTLLLGVYLGYKLDALKGTLPWFTLAGSALGLAAGLYNFLRRFLNK